MNLQATKLLFDYNPSLIKNKDKNSSRSCNYYLNNLEEEKQYNNIKIINNMEDYEILYNYDIISSSSNDDIFWLYDENKFKNIMFPNALDSKKFKYFKK